MTTDDAFLAAIDARPGDRTARLVYADWLDDHDAPDRAELVRVEEEMDRPPVFGDRFWALKPRRNALWAAAPADWLGRMGYGTGTVCRPVFGHGWPDGWRERWRLIREFTERWHGIPMPDVGGRQEEIAEVEQRLGRELPPSLAEYVAFVSEQPAVINPLPLGREVEYVPDGGGCPVVTVLHLHQSEFFWGVPTADWARPDPPVWAYRYSGEYPEVDQAAVPVVLAAGSLTEFALTWAMLGVVGPGGNFQAVPGSRSG